MKKNKRGKKQKDFLKDNYIQSLDYLKESMNFIYIVLGVFFVFALIGYFIPASSQITEQILKFIQELLEKTENMSQGELIRFIFFNNIRSSFFAMVLGILLGIFPMIAVIANGYLLGFVASMSTKVGGSLILLKLLPHGIFELPAIFISLGLGLKLGMFVFQKKKFKSLQKYLWNSLRVFLFIVLPLLIIAAIIEGSLIFIFR